MLQPLEELGKLCHRYGVLLHVDATATIGGVPLPVDRWEVDIVNTGLQKCLAGPAGIAPITLNQEVEDLIYRRRHIEEVLQPKDYVAGEGETIRSNYFDLAMIMDYWSDRALNHHTEATTMVYCAHECARIFLEEGRTSAYKRHDTAGKAMLAGLEAIGLRIFGDKQNKMPNIVAAWVPEGINDVKVRSGMLKNFSVEIASSFGQLNGRIWRFGTMGYNARKDTVLMTLSALETILHAEGYTFTRGAGIDSAWQIFESNTQ
jgi:(S)-ureidoglycine-glyoxylate aminotransferase